MVSTILDGGIVFYTGRNSPDIRIYTHYIQTHFSERLAQFWIFGMNGVEDFGEFPRLVLNHAIKASQVNGTQKPSTFIRNGYSYLYYPYSRDLRISEILDTIGFPIQILSKPSEFQKEQYYKYYFNVVINVTTAIAGKYAPIQDGKIGSTLDFIHEIYGEDFFQKLVQEIIILSWYQCPDMDLDMRELYDHVISPFQLIPQVVPSTVNNFWSVDQDGSRYTQYESSDLDILIGKCIRDADQYGLELPRLRSLWGEIEDIRERYKK